MMQQQCKEQRMKNWTVWKTEFNIQYTLLAHYLQYKEETSKLLYYEES